MQIFHDMHTLPPGMPHDGIEPLRRNVRWVIDQRAPDNVVPMAMGAALKLKRCVFHFSRIMAIEAIAAGRAVALSNRTGELKAKTKLQDFWKVCCLIYE